MQSAQKPQAFVSRGRWLLGVALTPVLVLSGCQTQAGTGALVGTGVGGVAGAVIGKAAGNTAAGAVIGAATGAVIGSAAGANADERDRRTAIRQDVAARGGPLSLEQIRDLAQNNTADAIIIDQIRLTRSVYQLTPDQIVWLKQVGVSDTVINAMQMTGYGPPRREVVVVQPQPVVGVGFGYGRRW